MIASYSTFAFPAVFAAQVLILILYLSSSGAMRASCSTLTFPAVFAGRACCQRKRGLAL